MDSDGILYILLIILVLLSGFFSASETAYSSINRIRLSSMAEDGDERAKKALKIAENYDRTLSAILIGNNIVNIASASVATVIFSNALGQQKGAVVSTIVMTIIVLTFGEILPKSIAKANADSFAVKVVSPLSFIITIFSPLVSIFVRLTEKVKKISRAIDDQPSVTEEELKSIIESIEEEGVLEEGESELVRSALEFDDITVQEVITPRVDIVAFEADEDLESVIQTIEEEGFSRIPVYEKTIDRVIGFVRSRDVLINRLRGQDVRLREITKECLYIHKTMNISQVLDLFQSRNIHIAIVTDDYGGTMGLVTMEDVLEQLVGEIWDEYDQVTHDYIVIAPDKYEISGDMNVYDMFELLDLDEKDLDQIDSNTCGGWVVERLEHIPKVDEQFDYENITITVGKVEEKRIVSLYVTVKPKAEDE